MQQEGLINGKKIQCFEVIRGFGSKEFVVYNDPDPTISTILPSPEDIIQYNKYRSQQQKPKENELGFQLTMRKSQPINVSKQQQMIQKRISMGSDKASTVTVPGSNIMSEIFQDNFCPHCQDKQILLQKQQRQLQQILHSNAILQEKLLISQSEIKDRNSQKEIIEELKKIQQEQQETIEELKTRLNIAEQEKNTVIAESKTNQAQLIKKIKEHFGKKQNQEQQNEEITMHNCSLILVSSDEPVIIDITKQNRPALRESMISRTKSHIEADSLQEGIQKFEQLISENGQAFSQFTVQLTKSSILLE